VALLLCVRAYVHCDSSSSSWCTTMQWAMYKGCDDVIEDCVDSVDLCYEY
jgi:hypothetical protein